MRPRLPESGDHPSMCEWRVGSSTSWLPWKSRDWHARPQLPGASRAEKPNAFARPQPDLSERSAGWTHSGKEEVAG